MTSRIRVITPLDRVPGFEIDPTSNELAWMLAEHASETMHDFEPRGEQPDSPALPADGALRGDIPRSEAERSEA